MEINISILNLCGSLYLKKNQKKHNDNNKKATEK